jgi:hypothetical protein
MLGYCIVAASQPKPPGPALKFFLCRPGDLEGTPYNTMQDCLAAREQLAAGSAFCIGR